MKTIAINEDYDIYIGKDGNIAIVGGLESVKQRCEQAARILRNELPYAQSKGIPFFNNPLTASPNLGLYETHLRAQYMGVEDVTAVNYIRFKIEGDVLTYEAGIQSIYGEASLSGNL